MILKIVFFLLETTCKWLQLFQEYNNTLLVRLCKFIRIIMETLKQLY